MKPRLTLDELRMLEALTGQHYSIKTGRPLKKKRHILESYRIGLMVSAEYVCQDFNLEEMQHLIRIYEKILQVDPVDYATSLLKCRLILKRYQSDLYDAGLIIKEIDIQGNYVLKSIKDWSPLKRMLFQLKFLDAKND